MDDRVGHKPHPQKLSKNWWVKSEISLPFFNRIIYNWVVRRGNQNPESSNVEEIIMNETKKFEVTSGKIIVTDPCYKFDEEKVLTAKNGTWRASVNTNKHDVIAELIVLHSDYYKVGAVERILDMTCPVDSGQAGVFDADLYSKYQGGEYDDMESFYGRACHLTCETDEQNGVVVMDGIAVGAVCSSGNGDGNYEVAGFYDGDELYGIRVYFGNYSESELNGEEDDY